MAPGDLPCRSNVTVARKIVPLMAGKAALLFSEKYMLIDSGKARGNVCLCVGCHRIRLSIPRRQGIAVRATKDHLRKSRRSTRSALEYITKKPLPGRTLRHRVCCPTSQSEDAWKISSLSRDAWLDVWRGSIRSLTWLQYWARYGKKTVPKYVTSYFSKKKNKEMRCFL